MIRKLSQRGLLLLLVLVALLVVVELFDGRVKCVADYCTTKPIKNATPVTTVHPTSTVYVHVTTPPIRVTITLVKPSPSRLIITP